MEKQPKLVGLRGEESIFRVFSLARLRDVFSNKELTLVHPRMWDDPFENRLGQLLVKVGRNVASTRGVLDHFYGQCWTLNEESDAIWRIYSPNKAGAKVKTSSARLLRAVFPDGDPAAVLNYFIGKVTYLTEKELYEGFLKGPVLKALLFDQLGVGQARIRLIKREAFEHEREVRVLYNDPKKLGGETRSFPIDPVRLFDEVVFDPRMDAEEYDRAQQTLRALGYTKTIRKSRLYDPPTLEVIDLEMD